MFEISCRDLQIIFCLLSQIWYVYIVMMMLCVGYFKDLRKILYFYWMLMGEGCVGGPRVIGHVCGARTGYE